MPSESVLRLHKKWSHSQIKQCVYGNKYMSTVVVDLGVLGGEFRFRQITVIARIATLCQTARGQRKHFSFGQA